MSIAKEASSPIFILSCARSGSTLLRYIVDTHPAICSPAELNLGALCEPLYAVIYNTLAQVSGAAEEEKRCFAWTEVRHRVTEIMEKYAQAKNKFRWCEKSPMNLKHVDILQSAFPDAKYICLYRHCLDVIHSCLEFSRFGFVGDMFAYVQARPHNLVAAMAAYWIDRTEKLMAFEERNPQRCFRINYESLVLKPADTLKPMFSFLGVGWQEDILSRAFSISHDEGRGDRKVMFYKGLEPRAIGKGATILRNHIPKDLVEKMNTLLARLGYPDLGPDSASWFPQHSEDVEGAHDAHDFISVEEVFTRLLPQRLKARADALMELNALYKIIVTSEDRATWIIDLTGPQPRICSQDAIADCTITVSAHDLIAMVNGRLNAGAAFAQGKLLVAGRLDLARRLGQMILGA